MYNLNGDPYTHKKQKRELIEYLLYFFAITTPLFEIPQAYQIYANHSARNVSLVTWSYFLLDNIAWLIYGFKKKIKPVIITYFLYLLIEASIVAGIIYYSKVIY